ncbi:DUF4158 domain-containing protein [Streptomyces sp. NPDC096310]|uniref:DUF4158 domain-containing protein n=1 Tax=Streptomyces sp. NPDC096310 TaxID=3366082 RepID=UPI00380497CE
MTSIERTAYPRFKRLISARELHVFFTPGREEAQWAAESTASDEHQLALLLALKSYQRMGCFPRWEEIPEPVVEFVRRAVDLPEGTEPFRASGRTGERMRTGVRRRSGVSYDTARARKISEAVMRAEAAAKNNPADLINIALERLVAANLELPAFSTLDAMASKVRAEVNTALYAGVRERMTSAEQIQLLGLLDRVYLDGKTYFNRLKKSAKGPTWTNFRNLADHLEWVDGLGDTEVWLSGIAPRKIADFAGEAEAADAGVLRDYAPDKRIAVLACMVHKAQMRARDDLATMFCKRVALKTKRAKSELEEIRLQQQAMVEALIGNYRTLLKQTDADGPAQKARQKAAEMTGDLLGALTDLSEDIGMAELRRLLGGKVPPALLLLAKALTVQAGGLAAPAAAVEAFGGFAKQYEQIEKVSAHHGNNWEILLYGQVGRDRSVMFDLPMLLELTATSEDTLVLAALEHARRHRAPARDYIPAHDENGDVVDLSFVTQN